MNKDTLKGKWNELKGKVKQQWGKLTDDEIMQISGRYDELTGQLQKKYGCKKEEAEDQVNKFMADLEEEKRKEPID